MIKLKQNVANSLLCAISKAFNISDGLPDENQISSMLEYPPDDTMGDLAFPCFKLSKVLRKAPPMIAIAIKDNFECDGIGKVEAVNGYLNLFISNSYYSKLIPQIITLGSEYGKGTVGNGKTVVLDYSSPNICKPFHIGHLASTVIGYSLKKIYDFQGYTTVGVNHLGDWGTQFGKQIAAYKMWGDKEVVENGGVDELVKLYVRFHEEAENNPELDNIARAEFNKLENGDEENLNLWKWFVEISVADCNKLYKKLGVTFDSYNGESFYTDKMPEQVEALKKSGLLKLDQGASIVDLSEYNMPPCLILKSDGSTLYPTRDIAAAVYRDRTYHFAKCIYVTASAQCLHFAQWFKVVELMGYDFYDKLVHVPYGMVSIDGEKLSTRTGNVILIRDLIDAAVEKVSKVMEEKNPDLENKEETAEAVGVGAIIFHYLLNSKIKDIDFVMDDALSFEGNTGPYAQYSYARTCSILDKAGDVDITSFTISDNAEMELAKTLSRFGEVAKFAADEFEPSVITRYILDVCVAFNRFYHDCPILTAEEKVQKSRIALVKATNIVLGSALPLICLKTPRKI